MEKKKILVIDDDSICAHLVEATVRDRNDIEIVHAKDGIQGIGLAVSLKPELIFLDIIMPELDGYQVARILKGNPKFSSIPIVVMSARAGDKGENKIREIGCEEFLHKPVTTGQIRSMIRQYLGPPGR